MDASAWKKAAVDLLVQFPSLFDDAIFDQNAANIKAFEADPVKNDIKEKLPKDAKSIDCYTAERNSTGDDMIIEIYNAENCIPVDVRLFDFNLDGVPEILIFYNYCYYHPDYDASGLIYAVGELYSFDGTKYRTDVAIQKWDKICLDNKNRIIVPGFNSFFGPFGIEWELTIKDGKFSINFANDVKYDTLKEFVSIGYPEIQAEIDKVYKKQAVKPAETTPAKTPKIGAKLGDVLNSDIKTYINGYRIMSFNINDKACIFTDDLRNYGFNVVYDNATRTTKITRNLTKPFAKASYLDTNTEPVGSVMDKYVYTDIQAFVFGKKVESFSINGNLAIYFEDLQSKSSFFIAKYFVPV